MKNKSADFVYYGLSTGADIFAITETWFTDKDMAHRAEITLPVLNYSIIPVLRDAEVEQLCYLGTILLYTKLTVVNAGHLNFPNGYYNIAPVN